MTTAPTWITPTGNIYGPATEGSIFNFILSAANATGYTLISGSLPPGLTLASSGAINGIIPLLSSGSLFTFTVRATSLGGVSDRTFNIAVIPLSTDWITPANLGTVIQESFYSIQLDANMTTNLISDLPNTPIQQYTLISGELPEGLTFHTSGLINGYLTAITQPFVTYTFTVKADGAVPETRTFTLTVTSLGVYSPQWNTISAYELGNGLEGGDLGNIFNGQNYSFQLKSATPFTSDVLQYSLYGSSVLPPGLTLSSSGLISGTLASQAVQLYPIIVQVKDLNNNQTMTAYFYFRTNFQTADNLYWVVNSNTILNDLSSLSVGETASVSFNSQSYQITNTGTQVTLDQTLINQIFADATLTIANSIFVILDSTGNYTLYQNYAGQIYNVYSLQVLSSSDYIFNLGTITLGQAATLKVTAISLSQWVRYELLSGTLPLGLTLDANTGNIEGSALLDLSVTYPATYQFRLRAYNYSLNEDLDFSITVVEPAAYKANKLTIRLSEMAKIYWASLRNSNLIPSGALYRAADSNFGMNTLPEIVVASEIDALTTAEVLSTLATALPNIIPTTLYPTNFIYTPVIDTLGNTICEAVSLKLKDNFRRSTVTATVSPGGIEAIRTVFNYNNALENWMNYYFTTNLAANQFTINNALPEFLLGDPIRFHGQTLPNPFENDVTYYVIPVTPTTFRLSASPLSADAIASTYAANYISFNVNETIERSGSLQFFFPALPLAYVTTGQGSAVAAAFNANQNIVPFGYFTSAVSGFTDTFFGTLNGHNLNTGDAIKFWEEPIAISYIDPVSSLNTPFVLGYTYYAVVVDANTFKLALTKADALANNPVTISGYIDDRTEMPFTGSFKKLLSTQNNTVVLDEANTRFAVSGEMLWIDSRFKSQQFTTVSNVIQLSNHGLETTQPVEFYEQLNLPTPLLNETVYYAIVIDENHFKLALTPIDALHGTNISFADFNGLISVDTSQIVFINEINTFEFTATASENVFISDQISTVETGDIVQLSGTIPAPFTALTNYSVIRMAADKSFQLASISTPTVPLVILTNFSGKLILTNVEYDVWRR